MAGSDFRIPNSLIISNSLANLQEIFAKVVDLQDEAASGKRLRKPSDAPADIVSAMRLHSNLDQNDQFVRNIDDATSWLGSADDALSSAIDQLHRVRDLVVLARNASTDPNARQAVASELQTLRASLVGIANTQHGGRALFGGTAAGGVAYDASGNYVGVSMPIERTISPGQRVQVNVNGDDVFGPAGSDVFTTLTNITSAVTGNPAALDALAATLDAQINRVAESQGEVGARFKRVDDMKSQNTADSLTMKENLSSIEDTDLARVMVSLNAQQVAYQAALTATARAIQPSLADFLR